MSEKAVCAGCGCEDPPGWAFVGDKRYCHGDDQPSPTCYEQAPQMPARPLGAAPWRAWISATRTVSHVEVDWGGRTENR